MTTAARWGLPLLWATLPLTAGPTLAAALDPTDDAFRTATSVALWLLWMVVLAAALVPRTLTLTPVRVAAPAAVVAVGWAVLARDEAGAEDVLALTAAVAVAAVSLTAWVGDVFVDGDSYGDERRLLLRVPGPLLLGPVPLAWAVAVLGATAGPLLLAASEPVAAVPALLVGLPLAWFAVRALHGLTQRFLVFVPGGVVVHDLTALALPVLLRRGRVVALGLAPEGTEALDLTRNALGTALEVRLSEPEPFPVVRRTGRRSVDASADDVAADAVLVAPSRPGTVVAVARARRLAPAPRPSGSS